MRATRFPARASGPAERLAGFMAHLRLNGLAAGPAETADALAALGSVDALDPAEARLALKTLLAGDAEAWAGFDALFDAYWFNAGRTREAQAPARHLRQQAARPSLWSGHLDPAPGGAQTGGDADPDDGAGAAEGTEGRLVATRTEALSRRDLRELSDAEALAEAERVAARLAAAIRDRRSRRRRAASRGRVPDMRRILRRSLARGGDPVELAWRRRPARPMRIVALCDVSGSMSVYARVFLAFLKGLASADTETEAFLFHTRLMRVTEPLRMRDSLEAAARLSLMAEGFGGGTDIAGCLTRFDAQYAPRLLTRRSVVLILSDGYCTAPPEGIGTALARLRLRAGRIVWLNPLLGWAGYAPVAAGIGAALPHLDAHLPANTLAALAALEPEFEAL
ncbi:MAG: VWA domain-containing protein [Pseudomonadota bacterium]